MMQGTTWEDMRPIQRLLVLAARDQSSESMRLPNALLVELCLALPGDNPTVHRVPPDVGSAREFLRQSFKSILRDIPLQHWTEVFEHCDWTELPITSVTRRHMYELAAHWTAVAVAGHATIVEAFALLIEFLAKVLTWRRGGTWEYDNESLSCVGITVPGVNMPPATPAICIALGIPGNEACSQNSRVLWLQQELTRQRRSKLMLAIVLGPTTAVEEFRRLTLDNADVIFVDECRLRTILLADRYADALTTVLYESLGFSRLNPYTTEKPVDAPEMFFGREDALSCIRDHPNQDFMIVGPRRIGKSSVCRHLEKACEGVADRVPVYADAGTVKSAQGLVELLTTGVNPRRVNNTVLSNFAQMVKTNYSHRRTRYLFLIDEIDILLEQAANSANWQLFETLRFLSQSQLAQTVFTGYRVLYDQWMDLKSPLYNYAKPIYLGSLDATSARNLVVKPVEAIGASYKVNEQDRIVRHLLALSGYQPYILQFLCGSLLEILAAKPGRQSVIVWKDVVELQRRREFREFIIKPFNRGENFSALERLILLLVVKGRRDEFDLDWLVGSLRDRAVKVSGESIVRSLLNLEIVGLLRSSVTGDPEAWHRIDKSQLRYSIAIPAFTEALRHQFPVDYEIDSIVKELRSAKS